MQLLSSIFSKEKVLTADIGKLMFTKNPNVTKSEKFGPNFGDIRKLIKFLVLIMTSSIRHNHVINPFM